VGRDRKGEISAWALILLPAQFSHLSRREARLGFIVALERQTIFHPITSVVGRAVMVFPRAR